MIGITNSREVLDSLKISLNGVESLVYNGTRPVSLNITPINIGASPKDHTHTKSHITDFPTSLPASDVYSWAKSSAKPSYTWDEIGSKPTTFTPSSHTHTKSQVTDMPTKLSQFANDKNFITIADANTKSISLKNITILTSNWGTANEYIISNAAITNDKWLPIVIFNKATLDACKHITVSAYVGTDFKIHIQVSEKPTVSMVIESLTCIYCP